MFAINFTLSETLTILGTLATPVVVPAALIETQSENPVLKTACKVAQLIPSSLLLLVFIFETTKYCIHQGSKVILCFSPLALPAAITFLTMPIIIQLIKKIATHYNFNNLIGFCNIFEKLLMTLVKTIHIAFSIFGFSCFFRGCFTSTFELIPFLECLGISSLYCLSSYVLIKNAYQYLLADSDDSNTMCRSLGNS